MGTSGRHPGAARRPAIGVEAFAESLDACWPLHPAMAGLLGPAIGLPAISPRLSLILAPFLSVPATVFAVRWVRGLLDQAR